MQLVRFNECCRRLGISRATMYRLVADPANGLSLTRVTSRAVGVDSDQLERFIRSRPSDRNPRTNEFVS